MPRGIRLKLVRRQDSETKVGRTVFYLLERVNGGGGKGPALVYIASAPAFSQAPDFDAVVATGTTRTQTLRKFRKELKVRSTELAQEGKKVPCAVYTDLEGFKQVKQLRDEDLMDVVEAGVVDI